jgi:hypothetical protein
MFQTLSSVAGCSRLCSIVGLRDAYATIRGLADDLDQHIAGPCNEFLRVHHQRASVA